MTTHHHISGELHDLVLACATLALLGEQVGEGGLREALGKIWLQRATHRLQERADRWVRGGVGLPSSEQAALAIIHGTAEELRSAGRALEAAAEALRAAGAALPANQAKRASTKALASAEGLVHA